MRQGVRLGLGIAACLHVGDVSVQVLKCHGPGVVNLDGLFDEPQVFGRVNVTLVHLGDEVLVASNDNLLCSDDSFGLLDGGHVSPMCAMCFFLYELVKKYIKM